MAKQKLSTKGATKGSRLWGLFLLLILLLLDQITKAVADVYFVDVLGNQSGRIEIVPGVIELCIAYNRGIAFSMFENADKIVKLCIVIGTALMMLVLGVLYCKLDNRRTLLRLALIFIIAGGVGNFIDRMYYQVWDPATATGVRDGVRDMVYLNFSALLNQWFGWNINFLNFGVCNVADFFIVGGGVMLLLAILFFDARCVVACGKKYKALKREFDEKDAAADEVKKAKKAAKKAEKAAKKGN